MVMILDLLSPESYKSKITLGGRSRQSFKVMILDL